MQTLNLTSSRPGPDFGRCDGARLGAHISITHAGNLVGVAAEQPVGLDVQDVAASDVLMRSADVWTAAEQHDLALMEPAQRLQTSAQWWTAKEAVLKSLGQGLFSAIESLDVRSSPAPWLCLEVGDDHAAAIAGAVPDCILRLGSVNDPIDAST